MSGFSETTAELVCDDILKGLAARVRSDLNKITDELATALAAGAAEAGNERERETYEAVSASVSYLREKLKGGVMIKFKVDDEPSKLKETTESLKRELQHLHAQMDAMQEFIDGVKRFGDSAQTLAQTLQSNLDAAKARVA